MEKLKNPFLLIGFYGKEYFCNRESEMKIMRDHFDNERNIVIYSWRRMGKTVLIKYFLTCMEKEQNAATLYVDLLGTRDISSAIKHIIQAVYDRFGKTSSGISASFRKMLGRLGAELSFEPVTGAPKFSIGLRGSIVTEKSLEAIGHFLSSLNKQIIITLDEFQHVGSYSEQNGEAIFRSWMQSFPAIRFIFSGSHRKMMLSMFSEKNKPFYRSAQLLHLNSIDLEDYKKFIHNHFEKHQKTIDDGTIETIYKWSRSQTYSVQLVCNKLFGMYNTVKPEYLPQVFRDIIEQESPFFSGYSKLLTKTQWDVLLSVAKEEPLINPLSKQFIDKYHLGAASTVNSALKMLQKSELIIEEEGKYYVHDVLLTRWLQLL